MSVGLPYLQKQRKSELTDIAKSTGLKDYEQLKKPDLENALDEHLRTNQVTFADHKDLVDYYKRFTSRTSPVKRDDDAKKPRVRRQTIKPVEEAGSDSEPQPTASTSLIPRTPFALSQRVRNLPPSPAVVTDAIDRQTILIRTKVVSAWSALGVAEGVGSLRESLSSVTSIEMVILLLEAIYLRPEVLPLKQLTTIPAVSALKTQEQPVLLPDLFLLVSSAFWAPFSLWLLTSLFVPLLFAYFFNLSLKTKGTRAHPAVPFKFDPLIFNIAKGFISFLVYSGGFTFWGTYDYFTIERVNTNLPAGWPGAVAGAAIGGVSSVYAAILRK